ncbi:MAG: AMP-binding protein [Candidatus Omnitrophica bacterium]|nr:AMP-binding protein [Candidatus Omnitrophota bacterium]
MRASNPSYQNLASMFLAQAAHYGERSALLAKKNGKYHAISWAKFKEQVERMSAGLHELGVKKGDRVALLSENRPEWAYADFGILGIGAINVPIYATSSAHDISYVIGHAKPRILFASSEEQLGKIISILDEHEFLERIIVFDQVNLTHPKL